MFYCCNFTFNLDENCHSCSFNLYIKYYNSCACQLTTIWFKLYHVTVKLEFDFVTSKLTQFALHVVSSLF